MPSRARTVSFRRLWEFDRNRYAAHLRRLTARDRRDRFMGEMDPKALGRHAAAVNWHEVIMLGCFVDGTLRGVGELHLDPRLGADHAELAFSVERGCQGHGIATELMRRIMIIARNRALHRAILICLAENVRMRRVALKFGGTVTTECGETTAELRLLPPTLATAMAEVWADGSDLAARGLELSMALGRKVAAAAPCYQGLLRPFTLPRPAA